MLSLIKKVAKRAVKSGSKCAFSLTAECRKGYNFGLSSIQKDLQIIARNLAQETIIPVAMHYDKTAEYPTEIFNKAWSLGFASGSAPEDIGGPHLGVLDLCVIYEELGYGCSGIASALLSSNIAQLPLILAGHKEQKKKFIGRLLEEPQSAALALLEPETGSFSSINTQAVKKGDEWILNGTKIWITRGDKANWYCVFARTNPDPICPISKAFTAFIVERDTLGVKANQKEINMGHRACGTYSITFEDVRVPEENIILGEGYGYKIYLSTFAKSRPPLASAAVGLAQRCVDEAIKFSLERKTHGVAIAYHEPIACTLTEMDAGVESSRLACFKAAWEADNGMKHSYSSFVAKLTATNLANKNALQIFDIAGATNKHLLEKLVRDANSFRIYENRSEIEENLKTKYGLESRI